MTRQAKSVPSHKISDLVQEEKNVGATTGLQAVRKVSLQDLHTLLQEHSGDNSIPNHPSLLIVHHLDGTQQTNPQTR